MKLIIIGIFVALMALGTSCAQISQPVAEVAPQGTSDGIQVHGHWTVTVTDPDGTVDEVHEFENALMVSGKEILTGLLAGEATPDKWEIGLFTPTSAGFSCAESESLYLDATSVRDLDTSLGRSTVVVAASCTVQGISPDDKPKITYVNTRMLLSEEFPKLKIVTPTGDIIEDYAGQDWWPFSTHHNLSISVQNTQTVGIVVNFSFH